MNNKIVATILFAATAMLPLAANAGEVANRIHNEQQRIDQGVASGQMTQREFDQTEYRLNRINAARRYDLRHDDGHLTAAQYDRLNHRENSLSKQIYFDKHNLSRQPGAPKI